MKDQIEDDTFLHNIALVLHDDKTGTQNLHKDNKIYRKMGQRKCITLKKLTYIQKFIYALHDLC